MGDMCVCPPVASLVRPLCLLVLDSIFVATSDLVSWVICASADPCLDLFVRSLYIYSVSLYVIALNSDTFTVFALALVRMPAIAQLCSTHLFGHFIFVF